MKQGTIVYIKRAPHKGVGTVIRITREQITVRWGLKGIVRTHPASALQQVGVPVQWNKWNIVKQFVSVALAYNYAQS